MSVAKSESLLRRDARAFCNKRHQRTIWEARRDERRTNQQLERELKHLERSRSYRERELDRDQVMFLNSFVDIFQKQCDIVAERKAQAIEHEREEAMNRQYDEDYLEGGHDTMTITTSDQTMTDATSSTQEKTDHNSEIQSLAESNKRRLRLQRDSLLPIIYTPRPPGDVTPNYSSRPNSPWPLVVTPSDADADGSVKPSSEEGNEDTENPEGRSHSEGSDHQDQDPPASAVKSSSREAKAVRMQVPAAIRRTRRLSPVNRYKIPVSNFRAESPSSKNSTIYLNDIPGLGGSIKGERYQRRAARITPHTGTSKVRTAKTGRKGAQDSQKKRADNAEGEQSKRAELVDTTSLNAKFMLEFEEASKNTLDASTGADIEAIRKQFLVNTLAKKLKISALRSGHFAQLDDIRKKIERRRKCVEGILEARRRERLGSTAEKETDQEDQEDMKNS